MPILSPQLDLQTPTLLEDDDQNSSTPLHQLPSQVNTSPQVVHSTLRLTIMEFQRAYNLIKKVAKNKLEMETLFSVPPQELHQFILRVDLISIGT